MIINEASINQCLNLTTYIRGYLRLGVYHKEECMGPYEYDLNRKRDYIKNPWLCHFVTTNDA